MGGVLKSENPARHWKLLGNAKVSGNPLQQPVGSSDSYPVPCARSFEETELLCCVVIIPGRNVNTGLPDKNANMDVTRGFVCISLSLYWAPLGHCMGQANLVEWLRLCH